MSRIETHYELFILLGNTLTISMPFKMENGEITCTGMQSLRLSTSFGINNKQITIGYMGKQIVLMRILSAGLWIALPVASMFQTWMKCKGIVHAM